jgi:hypothetical protein
MDKQDYRVTDKAGPRINGQRVTLGEVLSLTLDQARYHLDLLELEPVPVVPAAPAAKR